MICIYLFYTAFQLLGLFFVITGPEGKAWGLMLKKKKKKKKKNFGGESVDAQQNLRVFQEVVGKFVIYQDFFMTAASDIHEKKPCVS